MSFREDFLNSLPQQLEVKTPAIPLKILKQAEAVNIPKRFLYSYAAFEAARRLIYARYRAADYARVRHAWHLHYRWEAVHEKLYVFDHDLMEDFVRLVAADMRAYLILKDLKLPTIGIIGLQEKETLEIAENVTKRLGGRMYNDYMVTEEYIREYSDADPSKFHLSDEGKAEMNKVMRQALTRGRWENWERTRKRFLMKDHDFILMLTNNFSEQENRDLHKAGAMIIGILYEGTMSDGENVTGLPVPPYYCMTLKGYTEKDRQNSVEIIVGLMRSAVKMGHVKADIRWD